MASDPGGTMLTAPWPSAPCRRRRVSAGFPPRAVLMAADAEQIRVLLVEDDDGDAFLVEELLREAGGGVEGQRGGGQGGGAGLPGQGRCERQAPAPGDQVGDGAPPLGRGPATAARRPAERGGERPARARPAAVAGA